MSGKNRVLSVFVCILAGTFGALFFFMHMPEQQYRQRLTLGQRFLYEKDYKKAEAAFQDAIKIYPKKKDAYEGIVRTYMVQADEISQTDPKEAQSYYDQADSYVKKAKENGAGTILISEYGSYKPDSEETDSKSEDTAVPETESVTDAAESVEENEKQTDYVSLGMNAIGDAKTRYEAANGEGSWKSFSGDESAVTYALYDFTGDGTRDMVVKITPYGIGARYIYCFDHGEPELIKEDSEIVHLGSTYGCKNGFVCIDGGEARYIIYSYTWDGSSLESETLKEDSLYEGEEFEDAVSSAVAEKYPNEEGLLDHEFYTKLNWRSEDDTSLLEEAEKERKDLNYKEIYQSFIEDAVQKNCAEHGITMEDTYAGATYTLSDINRDGILDLIVDTFNNKHSADLHVYSYDGNEVHYLGSVEKDTSGFDFASYGNGFAFINCYKGYYTVTVESCTSESMTQVSHQDGSVDREESYDLDDTDLQNFIRPIGWYDYQDPSLLEKPDCPYAA